MKDTRRLPRSFAMIAFSLPIIAFTAGTASAAFTPPPNGTQMTFEGCRNTGQSPVYTQTSTLPLVCVEYSGTTYTTGNLGKGWNELDLVPFRVTVNPGASSTFDFYIAADMALDPAVTKPSDCVVLPDQNGVVNPKACGYDVITTPVLRSDSDASCHILAVTDFAPIVGVTGGTASTIFRQVTMSGAKGKDCILQWDSRLALGSHLFPGSSLQAYIFQTADFSVGKKTIPIPVQGILPPVVTKTETSSQGSDHIWTVSKTPTPLNLDIPNTCTAQTASTDVTIKINWAKQQAVPGGPVTIVAIISAQNNAARSISVGGTDKIYRGSTQTDLLQTDTVAPVDVDPNSTKVIATITVVDNSSGGATQYNDVFSATFTDKLTGIPIPGTLNASASSTVQFSGPEANTSATIVDTETISDTYSELQFVLKSATTDHGSISCNVDPLPSGKVTATTCTITGLSSAAAKTDSGVITFVKTVSVKDVGAIVTNGKLSDTATLTANDGGGFAPATASASATVNITSEALSVLTTNKTVNVVPAGIPDEVFSFSTAGTNPAYSHTDSLSFSASASSQTKSFSLVDLVPQQYCVTEAANSHYTANTVSPQCANFGPTNGIAACTGSVSFTNTLKELPLSIAPSPTTTFRRTYHWAINKSVFSNSITGQTNPAGPVTTSAAQVTFTYKIAANQTDFVDDNFATSGKVTITNPNFYPVATDTPAVTVAGSVCSLGSYNGTVPANSSVDITYSCTASSAKPASIATSVTWQANGFAGGTATGSAALSFGSSTTDTRVCDPTNTTCVAGSVIDVTDKFNNGSTDPIAKINAVDIQGPQSAAAACPALPGAATGGCTATVQRVITVKTGCFEYPNIATITETGQISQALVKVCGTSGELAPTQTTCGQYVSGANLQQSGINYSVSGGLINNNENPGVFFYFTKFSPSATGAQTIAITQSNDGTPGQYNFAIQSIQLFNASCTSLGGSFSGVGGTQVSGTANLTKDAQYIMAVKYSAKSITGQKDITSAGQCDGVIGDACYKYKTFLNGTQVDTNLNNFVLTKGPVNEF